LLTNYGEISCLVIDGWDAHWAKIAYDEIPFEEIYKHIKSLQPNCLISEHNAGKYPSEQLFYTDVKHYEQNAGQIISKETNDLPAQAGIPIEKNWFWKESFPETPVKKAEFIVNENLIPLNDAHCNFILNVAPNPDGLIEDNTIAELKKIGILWKHPEKAPKLPVYKTPIIESNLAKNAKMNSSWAFDLFTSDYANDDDFWGRSWIPSPLYEGEHFLEVVFDKPTEINTVAFVELCGWYNGPKNYDPNSPFQTKLKSYQIQLWDGNKWIDVPIEQNYERIRIHNIENQKVEKVRLVAKEYEENFGIVEMMIYKI
jgi:alpha-L-fucosidase